MSQTVRIDFAHLTLQQALDLAVLIEEEARDRYTEFADSLQMHNTPEAAAFFRKMARVEELHRAALLKQRVERFGDTPSAFSLDQIFDIEAAEFDEARMSMSVRQALEVAMRGEIKAHDFFDRVAKLVQDPDARALFEELREEELEHQRYVAAELARLPPDEEPVDPRVWEDEPGSGD